MRLTNNEQRSLILEVVHPSQLPDAKPIRVFLTGPAGCGKTFTINLLKETYNRLYTSPGSASNAYVAMETTGKAGSAIGGVTVHSALKITMKKDDVGLRHSDLNTYRCAFRDVRAIFVDEVSMMGSEVLVKVDERLRQITQNFHESFGGLDV
ncbi:ATP-dependent DNA helicase pif1-like [Rhipicephalus sanguineus]|uniref:ATP-dependent DNA helicase pif1-like n=1 Tax=Rhipicephalus sanguineus TaxID=34632 RepID=UPI001894935E|nr:ATP-dependent DNA helicase pif1-like [Rhipicephalus sanguineus]